MHGYRKLKGRITELYGSQASFAEVIGLSPNSVSKKLRGITGFSQADIEQWAKLLNIEKGEYGYYFFE